MDNKLNKKALSSVDCNAEAAHEADLTKGMEHMRFYVSVPTPYEPKPCSSTLAKPLNCEDGEENKHGVYGVPDSVINPPRQRPSRPSEATSNPQKRTDPFQFGSRYLEEGDDIFEFNAWDHVDVDDEFKAFAEEQFTRQRENPASDYYRNVINNNPEKAWDRFYSNNAGNFFKNRKWLFQEFPALEQATKLSSESNAKNAVRILEIGAGAGNTAFPLLESNRNPDIRIHAVDFSSSAVEVMRKHRLYDDKYISADIWDLAANGSDGAPSLPPDVLPGSVDIAVMIFVFSALEPKQWQQALKNVWTALKPGGEVLFRDYGRGDLAQVRFKKGRWIGENFYVRGDGTRVYFFEQEELRRIWSGETGWKSRDRGATILKPDIHEDQEPKFEILNLGTDRRMLVNRQRKLRMYRCWMQGRFRKPME